MKFLLPVVVVVSFCLMFAPHGSAAPMKGLVLYLPFDEGKGDTVEDLSGLNNSGVLKGEPKWVKGKDGTALQFKGAENRNYVEIPDHPSLNPGTEVTIAAWIYSDDLIPSGGIISKYIGANNQRSYDIYLDHTLELALTSSISANGATAAPNYLATSTPANSLKKGQWQHVAMTFKGKQFHRIYVNGELTAEKTATFDSLFVNTVPLLIGTDFQIGGAHTGPREFTGVIDEVVVFNLALSNAEVNTVMQGRLGILAVEAKGKLASTWGELKR